MKKTVLFSVGCLSTGLGFLGIFLPLLPTVPFILLAMYCFSNSSPKFLRWLENNRFFGEVVQRIRDDIGLTVKEKWRILIASYLSIGATVIFVLDSFHGRSMLILILAIETWVILRYKTHYPDKCPD
ncbi:YbaN family protein [Vibrio hannami]|uniref:YbaN family protein n=1 Tax=Vibrio hannami TaxID=2717094 RepID=UPI00241063E1|nr:YbaN family protein [Vibrio hannami]MDG3085676.1 YbaN family protein [Vibrio hannami]